MSKGRSFLYRLTDAAQLHDEAIPHQPLVEIMNDQRVLIENHRGVIQYGREKICVQVKYGQIAVFGCGLELARMTREQLVICGNIEGVTLIRRGK